MGWILFLIVAIIIGYIIGKINYEEGLGVAFAILIAIIIILIANSICGTPIEEYEVVQYSIQGLENNITTKQETFGAFVLGCGFVNSETNEDMKYYYFKVNDLGKKLESITITNYSNTYIRETNDIEPCLIYRYTKCKNEGFLKWFIGENEKSFKEATILVVPTNTIKIEYNVDI